MQQIIWGLDDNEKRQLYAIDLRTPGHRIITLQEDTEKAKVFRSAAKANQLICPDSSCRQPLIVKAGQKVRPHFAHRGGASHSGEGVKHAFAKQIILEWVKQTYPKLLAEEEVTLENGRRADLLLTNPETDKRMAIEVQYSAISDEEWLIRHRDYQHIGVYDLWLWGDTPPHCRLDPMCAKLLPELPDGQEHTQTPLKNSAVLELCQHETGSILFINPDKQVVGHAVSSSKISGVKRIRQQHRALRPGLDLPASFSHISTHLIFDELGAFSFPLTDCKLNPKGIETPLGVMFNDALGLKDELKAEARAKREEKAAEQERREAARRAEEEARRLAETEASDGANIQGGGKDTQERPKKDPEAEQRKQQLYDWYAYKSPVIEALGDTLPWEVAQEIGCEHKIQMDARHWKLILWELMQGRVGGVVDIESLISHLFKSIPSGYKKRWQDRQAIREAAIDYLGWLEEQGLLELDVELGYMWGYDSATQAGICADLSFWPETPCIDKEEVVPEIIDGQLMMVNSKTGEALGPWPSPDGKSKTWFA